jgi:hypothetical protein
MTRDQIRALVELRRRDRVAHRLPADMCELFQLHKNATYSDAMFAANFQFRVEMMRRGQELDTLPPWF